MPVLTTLRNIVDSLRLTVTAKDLNVDETINTTGTVPVGLDLSQSKAIYNHFLLQAKVFYLSKYEYKNANFNPFLLEEFLFQWGKCAIGKYGDKYIIGRFRVVKMDYNGEPSVIKISPKNTVKKKYIDHKFTVGEDAVVFTAYPNFWVNTDTKFGIFWMIQEPLNQLQNCWNQIYLNLILGRTYLSLPSNVNEETGKKVFKQMVDGSPILYFGEDVGGANRKVVNTNDAEIYDFRERTEELWNNFYNIVDMLETALGCQTVSNRQKTERMITEEVSANNNFSQGIIIYEEKYRRYSIEKFNKVFGEKTELINTHKELQKEKGENKENDKQ